MPMENSPVRFRRGQRHNLPEQITDGYISIDTDHGQVYADIDDVDGQKRIALNNSMFGVVETEASSTTKTVDIQGVPYYFDGLSIIVIFNEIDKTNYDPMYLSVHHGGVSLPAVPLMSTEDTTMSGADIEPGVPYMYVYRGGSFILNSGSIVSRPKWKPISSNIGL